MSRAAALALAAGLASFSPAVAHAGDIDTLYDDAVLGQWQPRYAAGVRWNYENVLRRRLTADERRALADVTLEFPLRSPVLEPFAYYAERPRIVLSTQSLKFFDDLCVAYAWLSRNGYLFETAFEYAAMLKYRRAADFGGRLPAPFAALRIPDRALADKAVDELAQRLFDSAVVFILAHELGHIVRNHPGYGPGVARAQARANETEADTFAVELMRRIGALPGGMAVFFQVLAHGAPNRGDFPDDAAYDAYLARAMHPVTGERLRAIGAALAAAPDSFGQGFGDPAKGREATRFIAAQLGQLGDFLDDRDLQRLISQRAQRTTLASLAPRRPGELIGRDPGRRPDAAPLLPFDGTYDGEVTIGSERLDIRSILSRNGERVTGEYTYGAGSGRFDGLVTGNRLVFRWREGNQTGRGELVMEADGSGFAGTWGNGDQATGGGTWNGRRR